MRATHTRSRWIRILFNGTRAKARPHPDTSKSLRGMLEQAGEKAGELVARVTKSTTQPTEFLAPDADVCVYTG